MKVRFGNLQVGEQFREIDEGQGAFTFTIEKRYPEKRIDPHDGSTYTVNASMGNVWTYFDDDTIVEKVN